MTNPLSQLSALLAQPLLVGTVIETDGNTSTVEMPGGGQAKCFGTAALGARVFIRDSRIEGLAPNLTYVSADV